jgi:hypothetical protein
VKPFFGVKMANLSDAEVCLDGHSRDWPTLFALVAERLQRIELELQAAKQEIAELKAVDAGRMAVSTAAILASEPEEVQRHQAQFIPDGRPRHDHIGKPKSLLTDARLT